MCGCVYPCGDPAPGWMGQHPPTQHRACAQVDVGRRTREQGCPRWSELFPDATDIHSDSELRASVFLIYKMRIVIVLHTVVGGLNERSYANHLAQRLVMERA